MWRRSRSDCAPSRRHDPRLSAPAVPAGHVSDAARPFGDPHPTASTSTPLERTRVSRLGALSSLSACSPERGGRLNAGDSARLSHAPRSSS